MIARTFLVAYAALWSASRTAEAQRAIPVRTLTPSLATSTATFSSILGVRQVAGGGVLVNDAGSRRLLMLDSTLTRMTVVLDSLDGVSNSYPPVAVPLVPLRGDSSLLQDRRARVLIVIGGSGRVLGAIAAPNSSAFVALGLGFAVDDGNGHLVYDGGVAVNVPAPPDSVPLLRVHRRTGAVDTMAMLRNWSAGQKNSRSTDANGQLVVTVRMNPIPTGDAWTVLEDGSIAIVRGQDYHIDFIRPDGSRMSTPKLPFDWRRLTDADKQQVIESARKTREAQVAARGAIGGLAGLRVNNAGSAGAAGGAGGGRGSAAAGTGEGTLPSTRLVAADFPVNELPDYMPPIRRGAVRADLDGNLWILPTTSAQALNGELVYDVVDSRGELFERVRLPLGKSLAGFGKDGVVYLMSGSLTDGFKLERTRIAAR